MATILSARKVNQFLEFVICPDNLGMNCVCPPSEHVTLQYVAEPPVWTNAKDKEVHFKGDWAEHCAEEALRIVQTDNRKQAPTEENLEHLKGRAV